MSQQQQNQRPAGGQSNGPTRPPQRQQHQGEAGHKRAAEPNEEERPAKQQHSSNQDARQGQGGHQQSNRGGASFRGGMRGGRGGFGGNNQQQPRSSPPPQQQGGWQSMQSQIPHPNENGGQQQQQQQQRPQSAHPQGQRGGRGGQQNGGNRGGRQQQQQQNGGGNTNRQQPRVPREDMMEDISGPASAPLAAPSSSSTERIPSKFADLSFKTEHTFASLGLSAKTAQSLAQEFKYETMSIVQSKCIPVALTGKDIVAKAKTGTGKTLAFLIPVIERVVANKARLPAATAPRPVRALVISPTRELAQQIEEEGLRLGKFHGIKLACVVGGLPINKDLRALQQGQGLDLLIATPGRLKDLLQNYDGIQASLSQLQCLVLDEADRLLDMGFKRQFIDEILRVQSCS